MYKIVGYDNLHRFWFIFRSSNPDLNLEVKDFFDIPIPLGSKGVTYFG